MNVLLITFQYSQMTNNDVRVDILTKSQWIIQAWFTHKCKLILIQLAVIEHQFGFEGEQLAQRLINPQ